MKSRGLSLIVMSFFLVSGLLMSQGLPASQWEPVVLETGDDGARDIGGHHLQYFEDPTKALSIQDVLKRGYGDHFLLNENSVPNLGFTNSSIWLRFRVWNNSDRPMERKLEIKNPNLDLLQVYSVRGGEVRTLGIAGDYFKFSQRPVDHRYFQFPVRLKAGEQALYYLRIDNNGEQLHIPIRLWSEQRLTKRDYYEQYLFGMYYGIILFVFFLNLFMYIFIREQSNLYYLLYVIGLALLQMALSGYAFEFLWPGNTFLANHSLPFLASISVFFLLLFTTTFLNTKQLLPRIHIFFKIMTGIIFLNVICSLINTAFFLKLSIIVINSVTLFLNFFIIPVAIVILRKGFKPATYFAMAFIVLIFGVFGFVLKNFGVLPSNVYTDYGIQIGSSLEVILLSFAIVDKFKRFRDEAVSRLQEMNTLKDQINVELERQVARRTEKINSQKEELEEKNKNITASITYASRIQQAILPPSQQIGKLLPGSFILYLPKDIVSGDFYWVEEKNEKVFFAAVDCTGHGVPGAMMSVVGFNGLNKALNIQDCEHPGDILASLNNTVSDSLRKWGETDVHDGMDLALCSLDFRTGLLEYAGAYNSLYLIRHCKDKEDPENEMVLDGYELVEIKADKKPIGSYTEDAPFTNHSFQLEKGEGLYIFSDGFADQFGGKNERKYMYRNFKKFLLSIYQLPASQQREKLEEEFLNWKGDVGQIDDICVIGLKLGI